MNQTHQTSDDYAGMPTKNAIEPAVLECVQVGKIFMLRDIYTEMVAYFKLSLKWRR